jgi:hypothetical protein
MHKVSKHGKNIFASTHESLKQEHLLDEFDSLESCRGPTALSLSGKFIKYLVSVRAKLKLDYDGVTTKLAGAVDLHQHSVMQFELGRSSQLKRARAAGRASVSRCEAE